MSPKHTQRQVKHIHALTHARRIPSPAQWWRLPSLLSRRERQVFWSGLVVAAVSVLALLTWVATEHVRWVPANGGSYTEGLIGSPQFINPLYASSNDVDKDLTKLMYSGLIQWDPSAGLIPDLAESYTISDDEKRYTFTLRDDATWHDGTPVTPRDIIFTFNAIQNPSYGSPLAGAFQGLSIEQVDERTVSFVLDQPFAPFLSTLTVGILPAAYWGDVEPGTIRLAERNLIPIGSGPYAFDTLEKDKRGVLKSYTVKRYASYYGSPAHIDTLTFKFYPDTQSALDAVHGRNVEGVAFAPKDALDRLKSQQIVTPTLSQITAIFFNLSRDTVKDRNLRVALGALTDTKAIVETVLQGQAAQVHSAILPAYQTQGDTYTNPTPFSPEAGIKQLEALGWTLSEGETVRAKGTGDTRKRLELTITTVDQPETVAVANTLAAQWAAGGIATTVRALSPTDFRDIALKQHDYDMLLSGILMGADPDPYSFWHSSQRSAPGLNLSQYADRKADELMEKARGTSRIDERKLAYEQLNQTMNQTLPALFLYQPTYTYVTSSKIRGIELSTLVSPSDRFGQVTSWYIRQRLGIK